MIRDIVMWNVAGATAHEKGRNIGRVRQGFHGLRVRDDLAGVRIARHQVDYPVQGEG